MNAKSITHLLATLVLPALLLSAPSGRAATHEKAFRPNPRNFASVMQGAKLFQQNCATCHGKQGEGAPSWRTPGPDGKFRPPPLNGGGHMWHHPLPDLLSIMRDGTAAQGGSMPPWRDKLSEQQMIDIIAWLQSKWPQEIYQQWEQMDSRTHARR